MIVTNLQNHAKIIYIGKGVPEQQKLPTTQQEYHDMIIKEHQEMAKAMMNFPTLLLVPGNNPVEDSIWTMAKENPEIKRMLEENEIREFSIPEKCMRNAVGVMIPSSGQGSVNTEMPGMLPPSNNIADTMLLIENENRKDVLDAWLLSERRGDKREGVIKKINARIEYLAKNVRDPEKKG